MKNTHTNDGLVALRAYLAGVGVSEVTGWRWRRRGWLNPINVSGKLYLTAAERARFEERAVAGEFSQAATGAAGQTKGGTQ